MGLVSLVLQQKIKPCARLSPEPTGMIPPGQVSSLPKEHKLLLIFIPEFYKGHLDWRNEFEFQQKSALSGDWLQFVGNNYGMVQGGC